MPDLFEPTTINGMTLENRFVRSATWEAMAAEDGTVTPELCNFVAQLATGSVGLIISGHAYVSPEGRAGIRQMGADRNACIAGLAEMTAAVHAAGGKIVLQLAHAGCQAPVELTGLDVIGPSAFQSPTGITARAMTADEIADTIEAFGKAARRAREAGFDGVQIHAAHGYLLSQFLSPFFNKRDDDFGGSPDNRFRIILEVLESIRHHTGPDYPVLIKINSEDFLEGGFSQDDMLALAKRLQISGIDAIELSGGTGLSGKYTPVRSGDPKSAKDEAFYRRAAERCRDAIEVPLILVGGIRSLEVAEALVKDRLADYIALSRPLICEPDLIRRWRAGDHRRSRCLSDNLCFKPALRGEGIYCVTEARHKTKTPGH